MNRTTSLVLLGSMVVFISLFIGYAGYTYYRSEHMICTNMPDGSNRCFANAADWIYAITDGELTVVPDNIDQHAALSTYEGWIQTLIASITPTYHWAPTAGPDGLTEDPTDAAHSVQTMESVMDSYARGTTTVIPQPKGTAMPTLTTTPEVP